MKIMVAMHVFNNFGGIINHNEQLIAGLKDLGHDVTFAYIKTNAKPSYGAVDTKKIPDGYEIGEGTGLPVHQGLGYISPFYSLKNSESVAKFVKDANEHDILIWQSIFGFKSAATEKDKTWLPMIEKVKAKQIAIIHDGNLKKLYSWIHRFAPHLAGLACVHPAAMKQADFMPVPRNMILNPQNVSEVKDVPFTKRTNQLLAPQTFKRWKRVDDLVAAVPYIDGGVIIAGDGMERAYMASEDKCKPEYYCTKELDPDADEDRLGKRIWQNALDSGKMEYLGFITSKIRDRILNTSKFLLDPSWSLTYGEHFNRSIVDAMRVGCVPIARNYGISDNESGEGTLLKPMVNYLMIPHDVKPKQFGRMVNEFFKIPEGHYLEIAATNKEVIQNFDREKIAQQFINLAMGKKGSGYYDKAVTGRLNIDNNVAQKMGDKIWDDHFEVPSSLDSFFA
jgi:glycosyltransferase involved in cell wall biosynthesis